MTDKLVWSVQYYRAIRNLINFYFQCVVSIALIYSEMSNIRLYYTVRNQKYKLFQMSEQFCK